MCSDLRQCSRDFLREFIEVYKSLPCIWQKKNKDHNDRIKRNKAYETLIMKYKEVDPHANKETVLKKISSFRTVYKKELDKVKKSEANAAKEEDIYKPCLWYFDLMSFLNDEYSYVPRAARESMDYMDDAESASVTEYQDDYQNLTPKLECEDEDADSNILLENGKSSDPQNYGVILPSSSESTFSNTPPRKNKKVTKDAPKIDNVYSISQSALQKPDNERNLCDIYGELVAAKLKSMDETSREICMHQIDNVLFEMRMKCIARASSTSNYSFHSQNQQAFGTAPSQTSTLIEQSPSPQVPESNPTMQSVGQSQSCSITIPTISHITSLH